MRRTHKGFTLVEIMIVVAIIGILIAIAVPGFLKARETSRRNACQENMTKIDSAVQQYILEENFADQADVLANGFGGDNSIAGWGPVLIGPSSYIRYTPECPSSGNYFIATIDAADVPVACDAGGSLEGDHTFPGWDGKKTLTP